VSANDESAHIDRRGARGIVLDEDDRVLFIGRHATPDRAASWILPGGGIDPGESAFDAARRELLEETGLHVPDGALLGPVARQLYRTYRDGVPFTQENSFFFTRAVHFEPRICGGDAYEQDLEFNWIPVGAMLAVDSLRGSEALVHLIKRLSGGDVPVAPVDLGWTGPAARSGPELRRDHTA
jgi:8-oxo-dGTP pyrophosphatase MutT (NUDIX family)